MEIRASLGLTKNYLNLPISLRFYLPGINDLQI